MKDDFSLHNKINLIFDQYTTSSNSLDKISASKVFSDEVISEVNKIYNFVSNYPLDWNADTMETVLKRLENDIRTDFTYLNDKAIKRLINFFTYEWK